MNTTGQDHINTVKIISMTVDFLFKEGQVVVHKLSKCKYIVIALIHSNGGNIYRLYDGLETVLERAEYEIEATKDSKAGFK